MAAGVQPRDRAGRYAELARPEPALPDEARVCPNCGTPGWDGVDLRRDSLSGCRVCGTCH